MYSMALHILHICTYYTHILACAKESSCKDELLVKIEVDEGKFS